MTTRRTFVAASLAAGLHAAGRPARASRLANDAIEVGVVGPGGRGRWLTDRLRQIDGVRIAAVCDVRDDNRAAGLTLADANAAAFVDYRKMLDDAGLDAVLCATSDHQHVPVSVAACEAGCDVYCEKPLTHTREEGGRVIAAVRENGRVMQVGTQQRSMPHLAEARDLLRSGAAGEIRKVRMTWNRNQPNRGGRPQIDPQTVDWAGFLGDAPEQPFDAERLANWRWYWDFGGGIFTDLMVHWADTARWFLGLGGATRAVSVGDFFTAAGQWETPDTVQTLLSFPVSDGGTTAPQLHFEGTFANHTDRAGTWFLGSEATLYVDRGRYELVPQRGRGVEPKSWVAQPDRPRGLDFYDAVDGAAAHLQNWIDCVRTRAEPACPVEEGVASANLAHLANAALPACVGPENR